MRILHTSDWHLGRNFGPVSLLQDQQAFVDWLIDQCRVHQVDLVVMAGDVFDRAVAPTEAVVMFRNALERGMGAVLEAAMDRWFTPAFRASGAADAAEKYLRERDPRGWAQGWKAIAAIDTLPDLPRVSVPNERWPVEPTVTGCASAKYAETGLPVDALQVFDAVVMSVAPVSLPRFTT